jgi:uncharacterized protein (DUF927 family)
MNNSRQRLNKSGKLRKFRKGKDYVFVTGVSRTKTVADKNTQ